MRRAALGIAACVAIACGGPSSASPSPSAAAPSSSAAPSASAQPPSIVPNGPGGRWSLAFDDEFTGTALDTSRWTTCSPQLRQRPCRGWGSELERYRPQNVTVSGGQLHLTATRVGTGFASGMTSTGAPVAGSPHGYRSFAFEYGYYEVRLRAPGGRGLWPAAWAFGVDLVPPFELDDVEILGNYPNVAVVTGVYPGGQLSQHLEEPDDLTAGFHTYGVDWEPDHVSWYVDGRQAPQSITDPGRIPHKPMFLMLDLAVGGDWPGPPDSTTSFPASLDVDYVRVFAR